MLARLAVRGGEVARLELADVNWRAGELTLRGKGGRVDMLPVPADVGAAIADYLLHARPVTSSRTLFGVGGLVHGGDRVPAAVGEQPSPCS